MKKLNYIRKKITGVLSLPACEIVLDRSEEGQRLYRYFTRPHSRFYVIQAKSIGVALVSLKDFSAPAAYLDSVNGKNSAAYFARKASRGSYQFKAMNANDYVDQLDAIHHSATHRQGSELDSAYLKKIESYPLNANNIYFGIFLGDELLAYLWIVKSGQLALMNRIMGHADHLKNGIMYLLVTSYIVHELTTPDRSEYVMYDTFFGASEGLKLFKNRCGFKPYRVKWKSRA